MLMLMNAWMMLVLMKCKYQMQCLTLGYYSAGHGRPTMAPPPLHRLIFTYKYLHALYTLQKGLWCLVEIITQAFQALQML